MVRQRFRATYFLSENNFDLHVFSFVKVSTFQLDGIAGEGYRAYIESIEKNEEGLTCTITAVLIDRIQDASIISSYQKTDEIVNVINLQADSIDYAGRGGVGVGDIQKDNV
jgi:hypothetical protein